LDFEMTDAHAGGSPCVPSRYGLLTGRFAARATLDMNRGPVIEDGQVCLKGQVIKTTLAGEGTRAPTDGLKGQVISGELPRTAKRDRL
jgi:hypothetical protein